MCVQMGKRKKANAQINIIAFGACIRFLIYELGQGKYTQASGRARSPLSPIANAKCTNAHHGAYAQFAYEHTHTRTTI